MNQRSNEAKGFGAFISADLTEQAAKHAQAFDVLFPPPVLPIKMSLMANVPKSFRLVLAASSALLTTNLTRSKIVVAGCLLTPAIFAYGLPRLHPLVIAYVYFLPLVVLIALSIRHMFKTEQRQDHVTNHSLR